MFLELHIFGNFLTLLCLVISQLLLVGSEIPKIIHTQAKSLYTFFDFALNYLLLRRGALSHSEVM